MASSLEEKIEEAIFQGVLRRYLYSKEVLWSTLFPDINRAYRNRRVDFYFKHLGLIIEAQGVQHYSPTAFDGNEELVVGRFDNQIKRDNLLRRLAEENSYTLIEVPYYVKNITEFLNNKVEECFNVRDN